MSEPRRWTANGPRWQRDQPEPVLTWSDSTWALVAGQLRQGFVRSPGRGEAVGGVGGASMIGLGVGLALTGDADG